MWCWRRLLRVFYKETRLDYKEIQLVHSEGDQPWDFLGRNDAKAETPVLCPPHAKSWLIGKDFDAERDWGQEEKGTTEDEMVGWYHWLDGHRFGWTQGSLACCDSWGCKESDTTEPLNWTESHHLSITSSTLSLKVSFSSIYPVDLKAIEIYQWLYDIPPFQKNCRKQHVDTGESSVRNTVSET